LLAAPRIVLHAGASPVVQRILQSWVAAVAHANLVALPALSGYRCHPAMSTDCVIIPLSQRIGALRQEGAGHHATDPGKESSNETS